MNSFDEFKRTWVNNTGSWVRKETSNLLFVVVYPDKLQWNYSVEKQTQITCMSVSGGATGAGTGHIVKLCYQSELYDCLKASTASHAMIVSVGMVFDMAKKETSISKFYKFSESNKFCKGHIIAKPDKPAFLHHQHIELNLKKWKELDTPLLNGGWDEYDRSKINFHDDYTPTWIDVEGLPRIQNFTHKERTIKAFAYGRNQDDNWKNIKEGNWDKVDKDDYYFNRFMTRVRKSFYITNNETNYKRKFPTENFDLIISPTAGYFTELLSDVLNFNGEVIFYDYVQDNLDIKQTIIEMNMTSKEIEYYLSTVKRIDFDMGLGMEENQGLQRKMVEKFDVDYWLMNLIEPDDYKLFQKVKGKRVYFNASNIFGYHMSHAMYTYEELINSYNKLIEILTHSDGYFFRGTTPNKEWIFKNENIGS